jgi:predicted kinase
VSHGATLVYLYGPPAVGKLTVATELQRRTGFRLFHNHLTVDAIRSVFEFKSAPFTDVIHRTRLDVFETAARNGIDVIFTNNSVWAVPDGRSLFAAFARQARDRVEASGGRVVFVQLTAPRDVLESRVDAPSRKELRKLVEPGRLNELLLLHDPEPLHAGDVVIDTSTTSPAEAAATIAGACARTVP